jgi:hypothetical protein
MQYALLIYSKPGATEALSDDEAEAVHREYLELKELPGMLGGAALHPVETATTVRVHDDAVLITDGPFADTRRSSPASTGSRPTISTRRPRSRPGFPRPASAARWRSARS